MLTQYNRASNYPTTLQVHEGSRSCDTKQASLSPLESALSQSHTSAQAPNSSAHPRSMYAVMTQSRAIRVASSMHFNAGVNPGRTPAGGYQQASSPSKNSCPSSPALCTVTGQNTKTLQGHADNSCTPKQWIPSRLMGTYGGIWSAGLPSTSPFQDSETPHTQQSKE